MQMGLRPFFSYFGSKWRLAPTYPPPEHETLIEPFAGSAGYALRYHRKKVILIEKDPRIAALWRWLIKVERSEVMQIPLFSERVLRVGDMTDVCEEARLLVGFNVNVATTTPRQSPIKQTGLGWSLGTKIRIAQQVQRIRHWSVIEGSYEEAPDIEATYFADPPYVELGGQYRHGSKQLDFSALADWCCTRRGLTIVCENEGASWLPFQAHAYAYGATKDRSTGGSRLKREVVYVQRR